DAHRLLAVLLERRARLGVLHEPGLRDARDHALEHGRGDVVLVPEVAVEGAVPDPEVGRDVGDAGLVVALLGEDALGCVEDLVAAQLRSGGGAHAGAAAGTPAPST